MLRLLSMCIGLVLILGSTALASQPASFEVSNDHLRFVVSLAKKEFIEGEPIILSFAPTNDCDKARRLCEPGTGAYYTVGFKVTKVSGDKPLPPLRNIDFEPFPGDPGWKFGPYEMRVGVDEVSSRFANILPVGEYSLDASYHVLETDPVDWHGTLEVSGLRFSIVPATGSIADVAAMFRKGQVQCSSRDAKQALQAAETFRAISDPVIGGVFAPYAAYWEAAAYRAAGDKATFMAKTEKYIKEYRDIPLFPECAIKILECQLLSDGDCAKAREVFMQLQDSRERRIYIKCCDEKIADKQ